jgi:hypothetical protein
LRRTEAVETGCEKKGAATAISGRRRELQADSARGAENYSAGWWESVYGRTDTFLDDEVDEVEERREIPR